MPPSPDETIDFIRGHILGTAEFQHDDIRLKALSPARWMLHPGLATDELTWGWSYAELSILDPGVAVLRFCPEVIADHLAGRPLGERTHHGTKHPAPGTVDAHLRAIETFWAMQMAYLDDNPLDVVIMRTWAQFMDTLPRVATEFHRQLFANA